MRKRVFSVLTLLFLLVQTVITPAIQYVNADSTTVISNTSSAPEGEVLTETEVKTEEVTEETTDGVTEETSESTTEEDVADSEESVEESVKESEEEVTTEEKTGESADKQEAVVENAKEEKTKRVQKSAEKEIAVTEEAESKDLKNSNSDSEAKAKESTVAENDDGATTKASTYDHIDVVMETGNITFTIDGTPYTIKGNVIQSSIVATSGNQEWKNFSKGTWDSNRKDYEYRKTNISISSAASVTISCDIQIDTTNLTAATINILKEHLGMSDAGVIPYQGTFTDANNVCGGSGNSRGFDFEVSGKQLGEYFTTGTLTVIKKDSEENPTYLAGAKFKLLDKNNKELITPETNAEGIATTGSDGKIIFTSVPFGNYTLVEVEAPEGYKLSDQNTWPIVVSKDNRTVEKGVINKELTGSVVVNKVDNSNDPKPLAGAEFTLTDANGNKTVEVTGEDGKAIFTNLKYGATYKVQETKAPTGYVIDNSDNATKEFTISSDEALTFTFVNREIVGSVTVTKVDKNDTTKKLSGAKFTLTDAKGNETVEVTGEDGKATFGNLVYGKYTIKETEAPEGYVISNQESKEINISEDGQLVELEYENRAIKGSLQVLKVDSVDNTTPLEGAEFTVYDEDGNEVDTKATNKDGLVIFDNLAYGVKYKVKETKAPDGYIISDLASKEFNIVTDGQTVNLVFADKAIEGSVKVLKVDALDNRTPLAGAEFTLYDQDGKPVRTKTTEKDGLVTFDHLAYGVKYTVKETKAPKGYVLNTEKIDPFTITKDGQLVELTVENKAIEGSVKVIKVDSESKDPIAGTEFTLTYPDGSEKVMVTNEKGVLTFGDLPYGGEYIVKETKAAKGYLLNEKATANFSITKDGQEEVFTFENTKGTPGLEVVKSTDKPEYKPGETIHYTISVTNTGNVDLEGIELEGLFSKNGDDSIEQLKLKEYAGPFNLKVGERVTYTVDYVIPETDLPDTEYTNVITAIVDGMDSISDEVTVIVDPTYALEVNKKADKEEVKVGETITYTIAVTNTGKHDLTNVKVVDEMVGLDTTVEKLEVGETKTFTVEHVAATEDIGELTNVAVAKVIVNGEEIVEESSEIVKVSEQDAPALTVEKTADKSQYKPGETVTYTITITNTGNIDLKGIKLTDVFSKDGDDTIKQLTLEGYDAENGFDLAVGKTATFTATYVIPETDLADTTYTNEITATVDGVDMKPVTDEEIITVDPSYAFEVNKTADKEEVKVGETITYTIKVINIGNIALTDVNVVDEMVGLDTTEKLEVGETKTFTVEHVATTEDIGELTNVAVAKVIVDDEEIVNKDSVTVQVSEEDAPALTVEKTADKSQYKPGETVTYTITITNTGNIDLKGIELTDVFSKDGDDTIKQLTLEGYDAENGFDLAVGKTATFTATYVIPDTDLADTTYTNVITATVDGVDMDSVSDDATIVVDPTYALEVNKTADKEEVKVGETITYTIKVTNTGNKALTDVNVVDEMVGLDTTVEKLEVGETKTFTVKHVATTENVGELTNIAVAKVVIDGKEIVGEGSVTVKVSEEDAPVVAPDQDNSATDQEVQVLGQDDTTADQNDQAVDQEEPTIIEVVQNFIENPKTGQSTLNILLVLGVFLIAGSGLYVWKRKH
ncbi:SpaA isopeptide-forming pilin-related protein [Bacillus sp. E214]|uniref:SpaA isopeptide-forming pilin-related protein n=1 Tax=Bacillus sp. E214 TaxID=2587156 RepID=UPI001651DF07|nr:SpaA isopeptide-forming pilin-related protein [Bacillus sp. E214]